MRKILFSLGALVSVTAVTVSLLHGHWGAAAVNLFLLGTLPTLYAASGKRS